MANDGGDLNLKTIDHVNIDMMRMRLLIVTKNKKLYDNVADHLERRGWEVQQEDSIKKSFQTVGEFKPDFILYSVNIPTSKREQIPTLYFQTFNIPVILFAENNETITTKWLLETPTNYKIQGQLSGPSAIRRIKNILHFIRNEKDAVGKQIFDRFIIALQQGKEEETLIQEKKKNLKKNKKKMNYHFEADEDETERKSKKKVPSYLAKLEEEEEEFRKKKSVSFGHDEDSDDDSFDKVGQRIKSRRLLDKEADADRDDDSDAADVEYGAVADMTKKRALDAALRRAKQEPVNNIDGMGDDVEVIDEEEDSAGVLKEIIGTVGKNGKMNLTEALRKDVEKLASKITAIEADSEEDIFDENDIAEGKSIFAQRAGEVLSRAATKSMEALSISVSNMQIDESELTGGEKEKRTYIVPIESEGKEGHIVISRQLDPGVALKFDEKLISEIKLELKKFVPQVEVHDSAFEKATLLSNDDKLFGEIYTKEINSSAGRIVLKYIEHDEWGIQYEYVPGTDKYKIRAKDLVPGKAQGADIFIHLPKNDRYYMYLKQQGSISQKQIDKLTESDMAVFVKKEEFDAFKKTHQQNMGEPIINSAQKKKKAS